MSVALDEDEVEVANKASPAHRVLHGFQILPDGSVAFAFDDGSALQRRDFCDRAMWIQPGQFHHSVDLTEDGRYLHDPAHRRPARAGAEAGLEDWRDTAGNRRRLRPDPRESAEYRSRQAGLEDWRDTAGNRCRRLDRRKSGAWDFGRGRQSWAVATRAAGF